MKTTFASGVVVTPTYLNAIQNLQFNKNNGDELFDGQYKRLTDDALSNDSGDIKQRFTAFTDEFKPSIGSGLSVLYKGGAFSNKDGNTVTINNGALVVNDNSTVYLFINVNGVVVVADTLSAICYPIAKVVTSNGTISSLIDLRNIRKVDTQPFSTKTVGGISTVDKLCTNNETFNDGIYYYRDFTVPSGVNINVGKYAKIFCSRNADISGTINLTTITVGGYSFGTGASNSIGNVGGFSGAGIGGGAGSTSLATLPDRTYSWYAQPYGSGGASGFLTFPNDTNFHSGTIPNGGNGGGGLFIEVAGKITISGTINASGSSGGSLTSSQLDKAAASGGGGGSGGTIVLSSLNAIAFTSTARINCIGGNGGDGIVNNNSGVLPSGGGAGGGGQVILIAPVLPTTSEQATTCIVVPGSRGKNSDGTTSSTANLGGGQGGSNGGSGGIAGAVTATNGRIINAPYIHLG